MGRSKKDDLKQKEFDLRDEISQKQEEAVENFLAVRKEKKPIPLDSFSNRDSDFISLCALGMSIEEAYCKSFGEKNEIDAIAKGAELYKKYAKIIREESKDIQKTRGDIHPMLFDCYRNIKEIAHDGKSNEGTRLRAWEAAIKLFYTALLSYDTRFKGSPFSNIREISIKELQKDPSIMTNEELEREAQKLLDGGK